MKIESIRIQNFRSFKDETISLDNYSCFIGPNGSGKSTILTALNILFRNNAGSADITTLMEEDFHLKDTSKPIIITVIFTTLSDNAKEDFRVYVRQNKLVLSAIANWDAVLQSAEIKQRGSRIVNPQFSPYFKADEDNASAAELKNIYQGLQEEFSDLPKATTKSDMHDALRKHEENNPKMCELVESQFQFYGWSKGTNILEKYIQWAYVPAVKDASEEQAEGKNTFLGTILQRTIRSKVRFDEDVKSIKDEMGERYREMIEQQQDTLTQISEAVEGRLQEWAHPGAKLKFEWFFDPDKSVVVNEPSARVFVGEGGFLGEISRMGHGMQRSFLVSLLQELAESNGDNQPTLILGFEEPELYQHPPQARHLAYVLEQLSSDNAQVLVTTHSPYFISGRGFESVRMTTRAGGSGPSKVTHITHDQISKVLAKALKKKPAPASAVMAAVEQIMQPSQNEMFFSQVPILVEGVEDVAFIATYMKMTGRWSDFRKLGCHFVVTLMNAQNRKKHSSKLSVITNLRCSGRPGRCCTYVSAPAGRRLSLNDRAIVQSGGRHVLIQSLMSG